MPEVNAGFITYLLGMGAQHSELKKKGDAFSFDEYS